MVVTPSGKLVVSGVVTPVGRVRTPSLLEITVSPAESVVTTMAADPEDEDENPTGPLDEDDDPTAIPLRVTIVVTPSGKVVVIGFVTPVDRVRMPSLLETTVFPAELVVSSSPVFWLVDATTTGEMVVDSPFGSVVSIAVVAPDDNVIALLASENTVSPAESVVSMIRDEGLMVVISLLEYIVVIGVVMPEERVTAPFVLEMIVSPAELTEVASQ